MCSRIAPVCKRACSAILTVFRAHPVGRACPPRVQGVFAKEGEETKKRFSFTKRV